MINIFHLLEARFKHFLSILKFSAKFFGYYKEIFQIVKVYIHNFNYYKLHFQINGFQSGISQHFGVEMIRSLYYVPGKPIRKDIPSQEFPKLIRNRRGLLWVDFADEPPETCLPILKGFDFHPLAIEDALQQTHSPKLDDWGDYLYIVSQLFERLRGWGILGN